MSRPARSRTSLTVALTSLAVVVLPGVAGIAGAADTGAQPQPVVANPLLDAGSPALSATGRYMSYIAVRRDQPSPRQQLRLADRVAGGFELLNPSIDGGVAGGRYGLDPVISADGGRVAFNSTGGRLVAGDTNGRSDAFVRDAVTDTTMLASAATDDQVSDGATGMVSLSDNGRFAVFTSDGTDLVAGSTTTNTDVFRRDLVSGETVQVTVRRTGAPSRGPGATSADVSADGELVAFVSYNTDLAPADGADGENDLFIRNMATGWTRWLSEGLPAGANPSGVVISPNGRWVSSRWYDGSLHLTRVSTATTSTVVTEGYAGLGAFSSQLGRFVFVSAGLPFVRDLAAGTTSPIPVPPGGDVASVTISGNGLVAAYSWVPNDGTASRIYAVALD